MFPSTTPRSHDRGTSLPSSSLPATAAMSSSFASTLTTDDSPSLPSLSPLSSSPSPTTDDDFPTESEEQTQTRYARRWLSISSPSQLQQQREHQRQHLHKLQSMPVLVAPTSAVDFSRHDVSLLSQLLAFAAEDTARRTAATGEAAYTTVTCVPTASIIHSIVSKRRESAATAASTHRSRQRSVGGPAGLGLSITTAAPGPKTNRMSYDRLPPVSGGQVLSPNSPASPTSASLSSSQVPSSPRHSASPSLSQLFSSSVSSLPILHESVLRPVGDAVIGGERHTVLAGNIAYPLHWCPTLHLSPFHIDQGQLSELEVINWCVAAFGAGVVTESAKARLLALESARWAAFLAPFASDEYVTLIGRFLALFVILDDQLVEQAVSLKITAKQLAPYADVWRHAADRRDGRTQASHDSGERIRALALKLDLPLLERSFEAIWNLSDAFAARGADTAWCGRFAAAWAEYVELGIREAVAADAINAAAVHVPSSQPLPPVRVPLTRYDHPAVHAAAAGGHRLQGMAVMEVLGRQRVASIGLPMMVLLLERACGLSLSAIDSLLTPATHILALIPALVNELVGLARDLREGDTLIATNFSLVQRRIFHCSLAQSIDFTLSLHDQAVSAFDVCCNHILAHPSASAPSLQPRLAVYLDRLRQCVRGYAQWHHHAARYKSVMAVDSTERQIFIFPVHDGHSQAQKDAAIQDTLKQYQAHADTGRR